MSNRREVIGVMGIAVLIGGVSLASMLRDDAPSMVENGGDYWPWAAEVEFLRTLPPCDRDDLPPSDPCMLYDYVVNDLDQMMVWYGPKVRVRGDWRRYGCDISSDLVCPTQEASR